MDGVRLAAAGFTNFTQDHLDYHGTMEAYFAAKAGLFGRLLPEDGVAVINLDDPRGADVADDSTGARPAGADGRAGAGLRSAASLGQRFDATGQDVRFGWQGQPHQVRLNLIGGFQAENVALAAGLVIAAGEAPAAVFCGTARS